MGALVVEADLRDDWKQTHLVSVHLAVETMLKPTG